MSKKTLEQILLEGDASDLKGLFAFNSSTEDEIVVFKFNLWSRKFFGRYFTSDDCIAHEHMDTNNVKAYRGTIAQYVNVAFRGFSKTARTKLFIAFCIANDQDHHRRFIRCISADLDNAKQSVTDIYNMFIQPKVKEVYPEIFQKTELMREETMSGFTTSTGVKVLAKQIGVDQRGKIMEDAKSDFDWYDDIETKKTIRSARDTFKIGENMEEARTGLTLGGSSIYTCNYFSEAGNVHKLVKKKSDRKIVQITPIEDSQGIPTWDRYSKKDIELMKQEDEDFEGERMCQPSASSEIFFDREKLNSMPIAIPIKEVGGFKMFKNYNPSHAYAGGHDVAGGVGLDSSTSVFIDFSTVPAQVVATYSSNLILPEAFGNEIYSEANRYGGCIVAIENNVHDQCILKAKQLGANLFTTPAKVIKVGYSAPATYGWNTNTLTKNQMMDGLKAAIEDGLLVLNDEDLIDEAKSYTRNDIIDKAPDIRLTTRHFDLVTACAIAWQMLNKARPKKRYEPYPGLSESISNTEANPAV